MLIVTETDTFICAPNRKKTFLRLLKRVQNNITVIVLLRIQYILEVGSLQNPNSYTFLKLSSITLTTAGWETR